MSDAAPTPDDLETARDRAALALLAQVERLANKPGPPGALYFAEAYAWLMSPAQPHGTSEG